MLLHTLPAFFIFTSLISPLEVSIILLVSFSIVYMLTPKMSFSDSQEDSRIMEHNRTNLYTYIQSAWLGQQPLLWVFIPFFILLNSGLFYADYRVENGTYTIASWLTVLVIFALPVLWWTVSIWRCSHHESRLWASVTRFLTIVVYYEYVLRLLIGYYYPHTWFNCQQLIIEFGDCI